MVTDNPPLSAAAKPLAAVVLLQEQLWPSIHAILHWHQTSGQIHEVFICRPHDAPQSLGRAQQLQYFLGHYFSGMRVMLSAGSAVSTPQELRNTVRNWMSENPDRRWLLSAADGLKLTALGLADFVGMPEVQVVYREVSGEWFELIHSPETQGIEARKLEGIDPHEMDMLPVAELVRSQLNAGTEAMELSMEPVETLPIKRLTQEGIARGWNWPAVFSACGIPSERPEEFLLAQYVGAGLREMGAGNLAQDLRLTSKRDRKEKLEIDLIVNHGGRVLVLDLILRPETEEQQGATEAVATHLRQAEAIRQRLAGLEARMVLVQPGRLFTETERDLAGNCGLEVIDQRDAPRLFSRLAALLNIPSLPAEMAEVEALLVKQITERGQRAVLGKEGDRLRQQENDSGAPEWVDIDAYVNRIQAARGQNWILWANRTEIGLRLERPANAPAELPNLIQTALSSFGRVRVDSTPNGYEAIFPRENTRLMKLRQALAGFVNRRLETLVFVQVQPHRPNPPAGANRTPGRVVRSMTRSVIPPSGQSLVEDLEAAMDQACRPKPPRDTGTDTKP